MKLINCSLGVAYYRLKKSSDPDEILKPLDKNKSVDGLKIYTLDDGSRWTAKQVAKHTGCILSTASTRLSCYTDPKKVLAPPLEKTAKDRRINNAIKERMLFDPYGHWKLINSNT